MRREGVTVEAVAEDSIAYELGISPGDRLLTVNGKAVRDILEYRYYTGEDYIVLEVEKENGEVWSFEIEKNYDEDLGLVFSEAVFDHLRVCRNRCLFCFMDQLPPGMRKSLRVKDDDYRLSFLYGNFITLTNLDSKDWEQIITLRLSPLYISVHTTDPEIRGLMLGNEEARNILLDLERLRENGLQVHTQVVLCPGINDKEVLASTVLTLAEFWPSVLSVGIVPVGLTNHRLGLYPLKPVNRQQARAVINLGESWQQYFRDRIGVGFVYLADEFFVKARHDFPPAVYYDEYPQLENGIGLARQFLDRLGELESTLPESVPENLDATLVCGESARSLLRTAADRLNRVKGLTVEVLPLKNRFFGNQVTVTGLLTGRDIEYSLGPGYKNRTVIIPGVMLKEGEHRFLDDMTVDELSKKTGANIIVVNATADGLVNYIVNGTVS